MTKKKARKDTPPRPKARYEDDDPSPPITPRITELARIEVDDYRYLENDDEDGPAVVQALIPPDFTRCQCEWPDTTLATFGPKPMVRCTTPPTVVAFQRRSRDNPEPTGVVSLCDEHRVMVEHMYPQQCYYRQITRDKKIGEIV